MLIPTLLNLPEFHWNYMVILYNKTACKGALIKLCNGIIHLLIVITHIIIVKYLLIFVTCTFFLVQSCPAWQLIVSQCEHDAIGLGMHRYHFFTNRYEYEYFYSCTCRYRVPIPILLRFGLHESAINSEADFILSSADYVKPIVQN